MINPTAGVLSGDRLSAEVQVETGARLTLTTPSATRLYTMPNGCAEAVQSFSIAPGGRLCFVPSMLVPHRNSRYRQTSRIKVERGGELIYIETLAPGRVASGECFDYSEVRCELELYCGENLNARECFRLRPDDSSLRPLRNLFPQAYWASGYLITERLTHQHPAIAALGELHCADALVGLSGLPFGGWNIKIIAQDSCALTRTMISVQRILSESLQFVFGPRRN
jgi:urease accessory protein